MKSDQKNMYNHATNCTENKYFMKRLFTTFWFYSGSSILNEGGEIGKGKFSEQIILLHVFISDCFNLFILVF